MGAISSYRVTLPSHIYSSCGCRPLTTWPIQARVPSYLQLGEVRRGLDVIGGKNCHSSVFLFPLHQKIMNPGRHVLVADGFGASRTLQSFLRGEYHHRSFMSSALITWVFNAPSLSADTLKECLCQEETPNAPQTRERLHGCIVPCWRGGTAGPVGGLQKNVMGPGGSGHQHGPPAAGL